MAEKINLTYKNIGRLEKFKTREEAQERQTEVLEVINEIKAQIEEAKERNREVRNLADGDWLLSAQRALMEYQIQHQELSRIVGEFSKIEKSGIAVSEHTEFDVNEYVKLHGQIGVEQNFPIDVVECEALQYQVLKDMASIKDQIARAVKKAKSSGTYASNRWFTNANNALKIKQATHQALLAHTRNLRREIKQKEEEGFERCFISAARTTLSKETFQALIEEAQRLVAEESKRGATAA